MYGHSCPFIFDRIIIIELSKLKVIFFKFFFFLNLVSYKNFLLITTRNLVAPMYYNKEKKHFSSFFFFRVSDNLSCCTLDENVYNYKC